jgi:hypothetical protein
MSNLHDEYRKRIELERARGLKQIDIFVSHPVTVDEVIKASMEIDEAIASGAYTPFPESF